MEMREQPSLRTGGITTRARERLDGRIRQVAAGAAPVARRRGVELIMLDQPRHQRITDVVLDERVIQVEDRHRTAPGIERRA